MKERRTTTTMTRRGLPGRAPRPEKEQLRRLADEEIDDTCALRRSWRLQATKSSTSTKLAATKDCEASFAAR
jgi:hypothetical protein